MQRSSAPIPKKHMFNFSPGKVDIDTRDATVLDNRHRFIDYLVESDMVAMNTTFKKQEKKLFTFTEEKRW